MLKYLKHLHLLTQKYTLRIKIQNNLSATTETSCGESAVGSLQVVLLGGNGGGVALHGGNCIIGCDEGHGDNGKGGGGLTGGFKILSFLFLNGTCGA